MSEVRDAMDIIVDGFWDLVGHTSLERRKRRSWRPAVERFFATWRRSRMMNILLSGSGEKQKQLFKVPGNRVVKEDDLLLYSLEITGIGGYWVEFSCPLIRGKVSSRDAGDGGCLSACDGDGPEKAAAWELASNVHRTVSGGSRSTALPWDTSRVTALVHHHD